MIESGMVWMGMGPQVPARSILGVHYSIEAGFILGAIHCS